MAETALTVTTIDLGLSGDTYSGVDTSALYQTPDETNGNSVANPDGRVFFHIKNAGAGAHVVTITSQKTCTQGHTHSPAVSVPASDEVMLAGFLTEDFNDASGKIILAWDSGSDTDCTILCGRLAESGR